MKHRTAHPLAPLAPVIASASARAIDPTRVLVRDVMQRDVLVLRADDSIRDAAEQLEEIHASGAPVVDGGGRLLGVLSLSDIARSEHVDDAGVVTRGSGDAGRAAEADAEGFDEELFPTEDYREEALGRARIADWMSPELTSVGPDDTLADACRVMLAKDIHRVFVIEKGRLCGVVSTKDVVRLLAARSARERSAGRRAAGATGTRSAARARGRS
ncbi:MAG: CBS domain-containing protein [Planctomycetota bacterium]